MLNGRKNDKFDLAQSLYYQIRKIKGSFGNLEEYFGNKSPQQLSGVDMVDELIPFQSCIEVFLAKNFRIYERRYKSKLLLSQSILSMFCDFFKSLGMKRGQEEKVTFSRLLRHAESRQVNSSPPLANWHRGPPTCRGYFINWIWYVFVIGRRNFRKLFCLWCLQVELLCFY